MLCYAIHGWSLVYVCVMLRVAVSQDVGALEGRDVGVGMRGSCVVFVALFACVGWEAGMCNERMCGMGTVHVSRNRMVMSTKTVICGKDNAAQYG